MKRLWALLVLWANGICSKHLCEKEIRWVPGVDVWWACPECEREREKVNAARVAEAKRTLSLWERR